MTEAESHTHRFVETHQAGEKKTRIVILLTAITMVAEITAGLAFGSMALLADGWHMGTHVLALSIAAFVYVMARRHADDRRYAFGTGKMGALGGFASAVVLAIAALLMGVESVERFFDPRTIRFDEAMLVAGIGLFVNLVSAWMLHGTHSHGDSHHHGNGHHHDHGSHPDHHHHHQDHNLKAAYLHVIADALTSIAAIVALLFGKLWGWYWLDPLMGIVGGLVILKWAAGLLLETGRMLLDRTDDMALREAVMGAVTAEADCRITDFHLWELAEGKFGLILSIAKAADKGPDAAAIRKRIAGFPMIVHSTIEMEMAG